MFKARGANEYLVIIQCDSGHLNGDLIACARYRIYDLKARIHEGLTTHVLFVINLPQQVASSSFVGFQGDPWISSHIDDLRPPSDNTVAPDKASLRDMEDLAKHLEEALEIRLSEATVTIEGLKDGLRESEMKVGEVLKQCEDAEGRAQESEEQAERRARESEESVQQAERVLQAERRARESDERVLQAERLAREYEEQAERRAREYEEQAERRARESDERVQKAERLAREYEEQAERRARECEERVQQAERSEL